MKKLGLLSVNVARLTKAFPNLSEIAGHFKMSDEVCGCFFFFNLIGIHSMQG